MSRYSVWCTVLCLVQLCLKQYTLYYTVQTTQLWVKISALWCFASSCIVWRQNLHHHILCLDKICIIMYCVETIFASWCIVWRQNLHHDVLCGDKREDTTTIRWPHLGTSSCPQTLNYAEQSCAKLVFLQFINILDLLFLNGYSINLMAFVRCCVLVIICRCIWWSTIKILLLPNACDLQKSEFGIFVSISPLLGPIIRSGGVRQYSKSVLRRSSIGANQVGIWNILCFSFLW